jgi:hypothetical protein
VSKGFLVFAEDSKLKKYTRCAYALALSIKNHMPDASISLVSNNDIPSKYKLLFDNVIDIPWYDKNKANSTFATEERWKLYHCSPYDETIILDADMMVLSNIEHYWDELNNYNLFLTSNVLDYRGNTVKSRFYRKTFDSNQLPNLYFGLAYFKKTDFTKEYFKWVEDISNNWELFYGKFLTENYPKVPSMDVTTSLAAKILDCEYDISRSNSIVTFTHMKPRIQNWEKVTESWQDSVGSYFDEQCKLKIGNFQQTGIFHYTEYSFLQDYMITKLEQKIGLY